MNLHYSNIPIIAWSVKGLTMHVSRAFVRLIIQSERQDGLWKTNSLQGGRRI